MVNNLYSINWMQHFTMIYQSWYLLRTPSSPTISSPPQGVSLRQPAASGGGRHPSHCGHGGHHKDLPAVAESGNRGGAGAWDVGEGG